MQAVLERVDGGLVGVERLFQHGVVDAGLEELRGERDGAGAGAPEGREGARQLGAVVVLEVHHALGEDEHVAGLQRRRVQRAVAGGVDQAHEQSALHHHQQLRRPAIDRSYIYAGGDTYVSMSRSSGSTSRTTYKPGVDVRRVDGAGAEGERGERDGLPQQRRELGRGGLGRGELGRVAGVPADEAGVGEEGAVDLGRVGQVPRHHEVGQDVGVAGAGTPRQQHHGGTQEQQPEAGRERHGSASLAAVRYGVQSAEDAMEM